MNFVVLTCSDDYYIILAPDGETKCIDKETYQNLKRLKKIE